MKIYHNQMCSKSRASFELLTQSKQKFETIDYIKNPLTRTELSELLLKLDISAKDLVRISETEYKMNFEGKELTEAGWIDAMVQYPILIERPIIVKGNKAVIGRPIENVLKLLED